MANLELLDMNIGLLILYAVLSIIGLIIWILTLVHQAKRKRWIFFILTLLFNIVLIVYWLVWLVDKDFRKRK